MRALARWPLVFASLVLASLPLHAEEARFPIERFRPAIDNSGVIDVDSGDVGVPFAWNIGAFANYALNPLVLVRNGQRGDALIAHRVGLNVTAALSLFEWVELGLDAPVTLFQARDLGVLVDDVIADPDLTAVGIGDLRMLAKVRILRARDQFVDVALIPAITVPTGFPAGDSGNYVGEGQVTFVPELAISRDLDFRRLGRVRIAGNIGYRFRFEERKFANITVGQELLYRAGVGYRFGSVPVQIGLTASGATRAFEPFYSGFEENPLEAILGVDYDVLPFLNISGGVGKGILSGFGTPDLRVFAGLRFFFAPPVAERVVGDRDGDGLLDDRDDCPDEPEDKDGFEDEDGCPDLDNDKDGIPDTGDRCPNDPEDKDGFEDDDGCAEPDNDHDGVLDGDDGCINVPGPKENRGCPVTEKDRDHDTILDPDDACPDVPGVRAFKGCADTDKDGIPDPQDKCPKEPETINGIDDEDGCPDKGETSVQVTGERIAILEKVYFDVNKATIQARSYKLLDQVASVLKAHQELLKIRIEGHTDSDGADEMNLALSERRCEAVLQYLVDKGVEAERLAPKGYGETKPIAPNTTKANKEKNRRVEFIIAETAPAATPEKLKK
jgi:outer membrane protein OmpA-like peptidoglycan-associated protein